ncbi:magnetosomen protein Mad25-1 [Candidatus Magnetomorum sp. HK-1]|nr:magnetosomen protein Mad25-1 [Candidatus Magnetomorum sp. HK-1]
MTTQSTTISKPVDNDLDTYTEISDDSISIAQDEPDIMEKVKEAIQDDDLDQDVSTKTESSEETAAKIKGLDLLKEGVYSVDLEKTINDMFSVIKSMESQLHKVLRINELLEKELDDAKQRISSLTKANKSLEQTIARLEEEMPSKRELKIEMEHLVDERNESHTKIRDLKNRLDKVQNSMMQYQRQAHDLGEEKRDIIADVSFLESRLNASNEKVIRYEKEIKSLKGEKLTMISKFNAMEDELKETLEEKYQMIKDLKESKKIMSELHETLSDTKLQAKMSFYKSADRKFESKNFDSNK